MNKKQLKQFDKYFGNIYFGDVPFREMREDIKQFISNLLKEERQRTIEIIKEYLLENHDHYGDIKFKKGEPYIQSMDFERFIIKSLK